MRSLSTRTTSWMHRRPTPGASLCSSSCDPPRTLRRRVRCRRWPPLLSVSLQPHRLLPIILPELVAGVCSPCTPSLCPSRDPPAMGSLVAFALPGVAETLLLGRAAAAARPLGAPHLPAVSRSPPPPIGRRPAMSVPAARPLLGCATPPPRPPPPPPSKRCPPSPMPSCGPPPPRQLRP